MGGMSLPITLPVQSMLAKAVTSVPEGDEFTYEPKWDGFRCIVARDGDDVELHSRGSKLLTRYFPELVEALKLALPERVVLDGEIVLRQGSPGHERLSWDALSARIHPAASRIEKLAAETPAQFVAFDLLAEGDDDVMGEPFEKRRARLEALFAQWPTSDSVYLTRTTRDADEARRWFEQFEGAGPDGVVAKRRSDVYEPGKRTMLKIKHKRTAEAVVVGDGRPFIAALLTLDEEALPAWANEHGVADLDPEQARTRPEVLEALQSAVDKANQLVSRAESIRKFTVLPEHLTEASGHLTPSLKVKRHVVLKDFAEQVDELYA
mgnify:CR=1 FL=1